MGISQTKPCVQLQIQSISLKNTSRGNHHPSFPVSWTDLSLVSWLTLAALAFFDQLDCLPQSSSLLLSPPPLAPRYHPPKGREGLLCSGGRTSSPLDHLFLSTSTPPFPPTHTPS